MKNILCILQLILIAISLTTCAGSGGGGTSGVSTGGSVATTGTVGSEGGIVEVTDSNSPIYGTKVTVPNGAVPQREVVNISINYQDQLPGPIDTKTVQVSKVIIITKDSEKDFLLPISVIIPYTSSDLQPDDIPSIFYWDSTFNKYRPAGFKDIDTINKKITFTTFHFSNFIALAIKGLKDFLQTPVDTGFRPSVNGFFQKNFTSYEPPESKNGGGCCYGMATYSIWYYLYQRRFGGDNLYSLFREGKKDKRYDDCLARELIARAFQVNSQTWSKGLLNNNMNNFNDIKD